MKFHLSRSVAALAFLLLAFARLHAASYIVTDLGTLGGDYSEASAINAAGQVVGSATNSAGAFHAVLYSGTGSGNTDLGTLGGTFSFARAINDAGQVVGTAETANGDSHGFLYTPGAGMADLNALIGPASVGWSPMPSRSMPPARSPPTAPRRAQPARCC